MAATKEEKGGSWLPLNKLLENNPKLNERLEAVRKRSSGKRWRFNNLVMRVVFLLGNIAIVCAGCFIILSSVYIHQRGPAILKHEAAIMNEGAMGKDRHQEALQVSDNIIKDSKADEFFGSILRWNSLYGLLCILVGIFGCSVTFHDGDIRFEIYACAMSIAIGYLLVMVTMLLSKWSLNGFADHLMLELNRVGIDDTATAFFGTLQSYMGCCGVYDYRDYRYAPGWKTYLQSWDSVQKPLMPDTCCRGKGFYPNREPFDQNCVIHPSHSNSNYDMGCVSKIAEVFSKYKSVVVLVGLVILLGQMCLVMLAWILTHYVKQEVEDENLRETVRRRSEIDALDFEADAAGAIELLHTRHRPDANI